MAESPKTVEQRLERLETGMGELKSAVIQVAGILTEQSQRVDAGFRQLWAELGTTRAEFREELQITRAELREELQTTRVELREELQSTREELTQRMDGVNQRLDRLIAVTLQERTAGVERLAQIEQRLAKLEERVGG